MNEMAWTPQQARKWLEKIEYRGMQLGMERVETLAARLDNPERAFPSIHIAGTNGKGSVAAILDSILSGAGLRTGLYTSPHLVDWTERITVGGTAITEEEFARALQALSTDVDRLENTPFETLTMASFWHFRKEGLDWGIIEVGLGGRLDATRLCRAEVSVITAIGIDHIGELGGDLNGIAMEKGSIIRRDVPVVLGRGTDRVRSVLLSQAGDVGAPVLLSEDTVDVTGGPDRQWGSEGSAIWKGVAADAARNSGEPERFDWQLPLAGAHMLDNLTTSLAVVSSLRRKGVFIPTDAIVSGIASVRWPGRLQCIASPPGCPDLILDVAHNPLAAEAISEEILARSPGRHRKLVVALAADKDLEGFLKPLIPLFEMTIATSLEDSRSRAPEEIVQTANRLAAELNLQMEITAVHDPVAAVADATCGLDEDGLVVATGSHMLVGPLLKVLGEDQDLRLLWPEMELSSH